MAMIMGSHVRQRGMMVKGARREFRQTGRITRESTLHDAPP
jgi:hypothetical protein